MEWYRVASEHPQTAAIMAHPRSAMPMITQPLPCPVQRGSAGDSGDSHGTKRGQPGGITRRGREGAGTGRVPGGSLHGLWNLALGSLWGGYTPCPGAATGEPWPYGGPVRTESRPRYTTVRLGALERWLQVWILEDRSSSVDRPWVSFPQRARLCCGGPLK